MLGGYLAEKLGYRNTIPIGVIIAGIGACILAFGNFESTLIGLACFLVGNMFFTPSTYSAVGLCYAKNAPLRDSRHTAYYLIFNLGFFSGTFLAGYMQAYLGYAHTFLISAILCFISALIFLTVNCQIKTYKLGAMLPQAGFKFSTNLLLIFLAIIVLVPACAVLIKYVTLNNIVLWILGALSIAHIFQLAFGQKDHQAKLKLYAFLILELFSISFWVLYMLEPSLLTVFIEKNVMRTIAGHVIPPSVFYSLDPLFVILFGVVLSWTWKKLAQRNRDLSLPLKFTLSLFCMGLGYLLFKLGIQANGVNAQSHLSWIIFAYVFLALAELLISPIGMSMAGRLAPEGKEGRMMGIWQVFTGLSALISGYVASMTVMPKHEALSVSNAVYSHTFGMVGWITVGLGVIALLLVPTLKRISHA